MATDYDAPRVTEPDGEESLEELKSRRSKDAATPSSTSTTARNRFVRPTRRGPTGEELIVRVIPKQADESSAPAASLSNITAGWPFARTVADLHRMRLA